MNAPITSVRVTPLGVEARGREVRVRSPSFPGQAFTPEGLTLAFLSCNIVLSMIRLFSVEVWMFYESCMEAGAEGRCCGAMG